MRRLEATLGHLFFLPSLLFLTIGSLCILAVFYFSFLPQAPGGSLSGSFTFENYRALFHDPVFLASLKNTVIFTAVSVALQLLLGLSIALLLGKSFPRWGMARALLLLPWVLPAVVSAGMWEWFCQPQGLLNSLLGLQIDWMNDPAKILQAAILFDVWRMTPLVAIVLMISREQVPDSIYTLARTDGATPFQRFRHVTLPSLFPVFLVLALYRVIDAIRIFDPIFLFQRGATAHDKTLSVFLFEKYFSSGQMGFALATSALMIAAALGVGFFYARRLERTLP